MILTPDNYYSREADEYYVSYSQYKDFIGTPKILGCEARALAKLHGEWEDPVTPALLIGSYVDAAFEGTLDKFKVEHPEIFSTRGATKGELKSEYKQAEAMIIRAARDEVFMDYMTGEKQVIMTGEIEGIPVKIKVDNLYLAEPEEGGKIVDLKTTASLVRPIENVKDTGERTTFIQAFGYDIQSAIYSEIVRQNTGLELPFYFAVISKDKTGTVPHPRLAILYVPQHLIDQKLNEVRTNIHKIQELKEGLYEPVRCETCDYCADTAVLDGPISVEDLLTKV